MKTFLRYALFSLLWAGVAAYIVFAAMTAHARRVARKVGKVRIEVVDSTSQGHLVSSGMVRGWLAKGGIPTIGTAVDAVDLTGIERLIARNGFVDKAVAHVGYSGDMYIAISQRRPVVRLLVEGMNSYATAEGVVFAAPASSSLYVPVVTGRYRPPFPADYSGSVRAWVDASKQKIEQRITELERNKYPFYKLELQNDRNISALRRMRVKRQWWRLESSREFELRAQELRRIKTQKRRDYRYQARQIQLGIDAVWQQQQAERQQQKKLEKSYEDFMKLLTFVEFVEQDDFWRSEVVQIIAHTTPSGAMEVELIPRSGNHKILFGRIEREEEKFDKLMRFYRGGLSHVGWNEYKSIDIRYRDQVVCKK